MTDERAGYVGFMTRAIAFALDAAIINGVALVVAAGMTLIVSLLRLPSDLRHVLAAIGGLTYLLWSVGYFVGFWSSTGQTPGARVMRFQIVATNGERLIPRRALVRTVGLVLAAIPLFAGYAMILFDARRRGLHDRIARTLVVDAPALSMAEERRQRMAAEALHGRSPHSGDERAAGVLQA